MITTEQWKPCVGKRLFKPAGQESDMTDLNFNIFAFTNPQTKAEYLSLAKEALRTVKEISDQITQREEELQTHFANECAAI